MSSNVNKALAQALITTPPRAYGAAGPFGQVVVFAVSTSATYVSLLGLTAGLAYNPQKAQSAAGAGAPPAGPVGAVGSYLTIYADAADLGIIVGATAASVTTTNAPALATAGTLSAGVYTGAAGTCYRIATGTAVRFRLQVGEDNFLGLVGSGSGNARLYISSEAGLQS